MMIVGFFPSYKNTSHFLPGVEKDLQNLIELCKKFNIKCLSFKDNSVTLDTMHKAIVEMCPTLVWFSGHGIIDITNHNKLLLDSPNKGFGGFNYLLDVDFEHIITNRTCFPEEPEVYLIDTCNSGSIINLKYVYEDGIFHNKIKKKTRKLDISDSRLVILISACNDFEEEEESGDMGGLLSQYILWLLEDRRLLTLKLVNNLKKTKCPKLKISINKIIDEDFIFFRLN